MPQDNLSSFNSGMTNSFHQTLPAKSPVKPMLSPPPSQPAIKPPASSSFSTPVSKTPVTNQQQQAPPVTTSQPSPGNTPKPSPFSMNLKVPLQAIGSAISLGKGTYDAYKSSPYGMLSGLKGYFENPTNFANTLGALSPIASPLMRTAGLPLLFGAYSALKDPGYLNALTSGKMPKLAAVIPPVKPPAVPAAPEPDLNFEAPKTFGKIKGVSDYVPGRPNSQLTLDPNAAVEKQLNTRDLTQNSLGLAGAGSQLIANRMVKSPVTGARIGAGIGALSNIAELAGVPERVAGMKPRTTSEVIQGWQEDTINVPAWLQKYHQIYNDPNSSVGGKALDMGLNTLGNPWLAARYNPITSAAVAAKGIDDWTGATNLLHSATGGAMGTAPTGKTMSVPAAAGQMLRLSFGRGNKAIAPLHR